MAVLIGDDHRLINLRLDFDETLAQAEGFRQYAIEQFATDRAASAAALDLAASTLRGLSGQLRRDARRESDCRPGPGYASPRKKRALRMGGLLLAAMLLPAGGVARAQGIEIINGHEAIAGEVVVRFRAGSTALNIAEAARASDASAGSLGDATVFQSGAVSTAIMLRDLAARSDVLYAEPNWIYHIDRLPNDSFFNSLWGLYNPVIIGADIGATSAWDISVGSRWATVAVIDTGVEYDHPDLAPNIWSAREAFTVNINGHSVTCPAGSHGFNSIRLSCDPRDDHDHGTHVAGIIGAVGNNNQGVVGINWVASIMAVKFLDFTGRGTLAGAISAIEFAIQAKRLGVANIRVLNNSWGGGPFSQALLDEIIKANDTDMLFVAAAGNETSNNDFVPAYPASFEAENVVSVAATDEMDHLPWFSNWGRRTVHLAAPGVHILSTVRCPFTGDCRSAYRSSSGTSMAAPHVSGAAALVLSRCRLNTGELKQALMDSVDSEPELVGTTISGGRLSLSKALQSCAPPVFHKSPWWRSRKEIDSP